MNTRPCRARALVSQHKGMQQGRQKFRINIKS